MVKKILVANRGEVAVRIIGACKEMGIQTVSVFSEADKDSLPVALADERICIGGSASSESYLNTQNILAAALAMDVEAIHGGYGFLSENASFAEQCKENGIIFIGPKPNVMKELGDKELGRAVAKKVGVPIISGSPILQSDAEAKAIAKEIGYPLLVKATAGGGGKGIRVVTAESELIEAVNVASQEAESAFGNGDVFLEKYLQNVRHIEIQVLADHFGNVICFPERDCSLQLNKQKVLEETPSPSLVVTETLREKLQASAKKIVEAVGYTNAGTVEFLLTPDGEFYFIEMNPRLQVEHMITEYISDVDIVKYQIRIACEVPLDFKQEDIAINGHSMECRINAKSGGKLKFFHVPTGRGLQFDTALTQDCNVVPFYDSMIGKLVIHGKNRQEVLRKMERALCELVIEGVPTNIDEQLQLIRSESVKTGDYHTLKLAEILSEKR